MLPPLQRRVENNPNLRRVFGTLASPEFRRIEVNLSPLSLAQMEALLFRLTPDWLAGAPGGVADTVYDLIEDFRRGGVHPLVTPLELQTLIVTHGGTIGPSATDLCTRLDSLRTLLMTPAGGISGANLIHLVQQMSAAGGPALVAAVRTLRTAHAGVAATPAETYDCLIAMRTASVTVPAMNAGDAAAFIQRLNSLPGAEIAGTIASLGNCACGPLHGAIGPTGMEYLSWRRLGRLVQPNGWTPVEVDGTLGALRAAGANTLERLAELVEALTAPTVAGDRLSAARLAELAAAVNGYAKLRWVALGVHGGTRFAHAYDVLRTRHAAADIADAIDTAYDVGRAEGLTSNQFTQILTIALARNRPILGVRRFVAWAASAHREDATVDWAESIDRIADLATDHQAGLPVLPAAIREHVGADRLNVRDDDLRHYIYGHTYAWLVFSRLNLRRSEAGYLSFWPRGTTIQNVQDDARAMIARADVQALMDRPGGGRLAVNGTRSGTIANRRMTVERRANHQYDLTQLFPTGGVGTRQVHWRVLAGAGMFLGYMADEAVVWAAL